MTTTTTTATDYLTVIEFANGGIMIMTSEDAAVDAINALIANRQTFTLRDLTAAERIRYAEAMFTA